MLLNGIWHELLVCCVSTFRDQWAATCEWRLSTRAIREFMMGMPCGRVWPGVRGAWRGYRSCFFSQLFQETRILFWGPARQRRVRRTPKAKLVRAGSVLGWAAAREHPAP